MKRFSRLSAYLTRAVTSICLALLGEAIPVLASTDWVPDRGDTHTYVSSTTGKTISNWWVWNTDADLAGLRRDNNETLEVDVVFYNYDGTAWAINWPCSLCYYGVNWDSNQPRAYADTQMDDSYNERPFSVGSADATQFVKGRWYYFYIYDVRGASSGPTKTKLQAQRGHRWPSTCYSTYCVYAEDTVTIVPFSAYYFSPGHCYWRYPRDTSDYCNQW